MNKCLLLVILAFACGISAPFAAETDRPATATAPASTTKPAPADPLYLLIVGEPETFAKTFPPAPPASRRQIGFAPMLYTLKTTETELAKQVTAALDKAEQTGYPVFFQLDDWNFPPAWHDPEMVEWTAFPKPGEKHGPLVRRRWINWGSWLFSEAPPNFESPRFRELMRSRLANGVAAPIVQRLDQWRQSGKTYLFAGMAVGWETGFYNLTVIDPKNRPAAGAEVFKDDELVRTGYAALTARGQTAESIQKLATQQGRTEEQVMYDLMTGVLHDYTEFLAKTCHDTGIPTERIYSHYAAARTMVEPTTGTQPATRSGATTGTVQFKESPGAAALRNSPALQELFRLNGIMPPMTAAVNPYCRPGATAGYGFCNPDLVAAEFQQTGKPAWGAVEIEITDNIRDAATCQAYLDHLTDLGARVIGVFGWWEKGDHQFSVQATGAPQAMKTWLQEP